MNAFEDIWRLRPDYSLLGFKSNPFTITPLFFNYSDKALSERDEKLFVPTESARQSVTSFGLGKRLLVWGEVGVGKTTIMNMLLYLGSSREDLLPIRVVIKEDTVSRAVQELLYNYCFGLISELRKKKLAKPVESAKKWLLEKKYADKLYDFMTRLMGPFEEEISAEKRVSSRAGLSVAVQAETAGEEALTSSLRTYVQSLPIRAVQDRLVELQALTSSLGYRGVVFAIDEADHIEQIDKVLAMLTASREIFFTSQSYAFVVAGSKDLADQDRRGEVSGIFDSTIHVGRLREDDIKQALFRRVQLENPELTLQKVFDNEALIAILQHCGGILKTTLRLAENALDEAAAQRASRINLKHVMAASRRASVSLLSNLKDYEINVLRVLSRLGQASPGDREFQRRAQLSRPRLTTVLNALLDKRMVDKAKKARKNVYCVKPHIKAFLG